MKTPAEILAKNANGLPSQSSTYATPTGDQARGRAQQDLIPVETKTHVNMIFARFMAIYGHKFKSCFETQDEIRIAKREWALSLRPYSERQLVAAVDYCKENTEWMPSVAEFLKIIRRQSGDHGLPSVMVAYEEAALHAEHPTRHSWSHPAVYHAGKATGWFRVRSEDQDHVLPDFTYHYEVMMRRVREGDDLSLPVHQPLEDKRDNTLFDFIRRWGEESGLPAEQASSLLYYLTKPKGSKVRARMRAAAQQRLAEQGSSLVLPEDYQ